MPTQKELIAAHRLYLADRWRQKYPQGQYRVFLIRNTENELTHIQMYKLSTRPTTWSLPDCWAVVQSFPHLIVHVEQHRLWNLSGPGSSNSVYNYDTMEKAFRKARANGATEALIEKYLELEARDVERQANR